MEVVTAPSGGTTRLPWAEDAAPVATVVTTAATAAQVPDPPPPPPPTSASSEVTVQRGDSFWTIAEAELASRSASTPTDAEVAPYWRAVIELNEHLLVEPGNPDLIYPGQVFQLPQ